MKLLAIACLIAVACAYPSRLGEEKCTYGPSYWCENYKQAMECRAIEHCREFVWKAKGADKCDECKAAVTQLHTFVSTNSSKVLEILNNICAGLSIGSGGCKLAVKTYGKQIIAALEQITSDSEKLCKELELCSSTGKVKIMKEIFVEKLKTHPYILALKSVKADYCEDCKLVFGEIKDLLEDKDMQKEIIAAVESLCSEFGSFAAQCKSYVDQYLPLVLDELASLDDPTKICDELGLCNSTQKAANIMNALHRLQPQAKKVLIPIMPGPVILTPPKDKQNEKSADADKCDECKAAVTQLHTFISTNSSKVLEILNNICAGLSTGSAQCKLAVEMYGKQIVAALELITSDSEKICKELELCSSTGKVKIMKEIFIEKLKTHPYILALKSVKADFCEDCKLVFGEIKDLLEDKDMQKEIIAAVESLCSEFGSFAAQCKSYVDQYLPSVLDELASLDDPTKICDELGLCNSTQKAANIMNALHHLQPQAKKVLIPIMPGPVILTPPKDKKNQKSADDKCEECEGAVKLANYYLTNNSTKVLDIMNNLCATLGSKAAECKLAVAFYGKQIIAALKQITSDPEKLCKELEMCPSTGKEEIIKKLFLKNLKTHPYILHLRSVKVDYCNDCKLVFAELKDMLEDKAMQKELSTLLESLCAELGSFADQCKSYVDAFLPLILEELATLDDPTELCTELGLCNSSSKAVDLLKATRLIPAQKKPFFPIMPGPVMITPEKEDKKVKAPATSVECIMCEFAMRELDSMLGDNATKEEIEAALEKVCSLLPSTVRSECDDFVKKYGDEIIKLLLQEFSPDEICTELGLCSSKGKPAKFSFKKPNDETCDLCKMAVQYLENILESNATEDEIKKALEEICDMLPASLKTECLKLVDNYTSDLIWLLTEFPPYAVCKCNALVEEYGDLLIKIILGEITPEEVCKLLKLCTASKKLQLKDECVLGESYWCASYKNALKCDALEHCNYLA